MPPFKPSQAQLKALLERIVTRRQSARMTPQTEQMGQGMNPSWVDALIGTQPAQSQEYGRLIDRTAVREGVPPTPMTMPIQQAREMFFGNPERYKEVTGTPSAKWMRPAVPNSAEDVTAPMAGGIAFERMKFPPIVPSSVRSTARSMGNAPDMMAEAAMPEGAQGMAGAMEALMRPKAMPKEAQSLSEHMSTALMMDDLWKSTGGLRSSVGMRWKDLWQASRLKGKVSSAKDYFLSSAIRFKEDPARFAKSFPREAKLLESIGEAYKAETGIAPF